MPSPVKLLINLSDYKLESANTLIRKIPAEGEVYRIKLYSVLSPSGPIVVDNVAQTTPTPGFSPCLSITQDILSSSQYTIEQYTERDITVNIGPGSLLNAKEIKGYLYHGDIVIPINDKTTSINYSVVTQGAGTNDTAVSHIANGLDFANAQAAASREKLGMWAYPYWHDLESKDVSFTFVSTYRQCKYKFIHIYVTHNDTLYNKAPDDTEESSAALELGSVIHKAAGDCILELEANGLLQGTLDDKTSCIAKYVNQAIHEYNALVGQGIVPPLKLEGPSNIHKMIENVATRSYWQEYKPIATEFEINVPLSASVNLTGSIDVVAKHRTENAIMLSDFKSNVRPYAPFDTTEIIGSITTGTNTITDIINVSIMMPGMCVHRDGIPANTKITSVDLDAQSATMDNTATATVRGAITIPGGEHYDNDKFKLAQVAYYSLAINKYSELNASSVRLQYDFVRYKETFTVTGTITKDSTAITDITNVVNISPGMKISGQGIPISTTIISVDVAENSAVMSSAGISTHTGITIDIFDRIKRPIVILQDQLAPPVNECDPEREIYQNSSYVSNWLNGTLPYEQGLIDLGLEAHSFALSHAHGQGDVETSPFEYCYSCPAYKICPDPDNVKETAREPFKPFIDFPVGVNLQPLKEQRPTEKDETLIDEILDYIFMRGDPIPHPDHRNPEVVESIRKRYVEYISNVRQRIKDARDIKVQYEERTNVQIGAVMVTSPITNITLTDTKQVETYDTLRVPEPTTIRKEGSQRMAQITITMSSAEAINHELRHILAQIRAFPFMMIRNPDITKALVPIGPNTTLYFRQFPQQVMRVIYKGDISPHPDSTNNPDYAEMTERDRIIKEARERVNMYAGEDDASTRELLQTGWWDPTRVTKWTEFELKKNMKEAKEKIYKNAKFMYAIRRAKVSPVPNLVDTINLTLDVQLVDTETVSETGAIRFLFDDQSVMEQLCWEANFYESTKFTDSHNMRLIENVTKLNPVDSNTLNVEGVSNTSIGESLNGNETLGSTSGLGEDYGAASPVIIKIPLVPGRKPSEMGRSCVKTKDEFDLKYPNFETDIRRFLDNPAPQANVENGTSTYDSVFYDGKETNIASNANLLFVCYPQDHYLFKSGSNGETIVLDKYTFDNNKQKSTGTVILALYQVGNNFVPLECIGENFASLYMADDDSIITPQGHGELSNMLGGRHYIAPIRVADDLLHLRYTKSKTRRDSILNNLTGINNLFMPKRSEPPVPGNSYNFKNALAWQKGNEALLTELGPFTWGIDRKINLDTDRGLVDRSIVGMLPTYLAPPLSFTRIEKSINMITPQDLYDMLIEKYMNKATNDMATEAYIGSDTLGIKFTTLTKLLWAYRFTCAFNLPEEYNTYNTNSEGLRFEIVDPFIDETLTQTRYPYHLTKHSRSYKIAYPTNHKVNIPITYYKLPGQEKSIGYFPGEHLAKIIMTMGTNKLAVVPILFMDISKRIYPNPPTENGVVGYGSNILINNETTITELEKSPTQIGAVILPPYLSREGFTWSVQTLSALSNYFPFTTVSSHMSASTTRSQLRDRAKYSPTPLRHIPVNQEMLPELLSSNQNKTATRLCIASANLFWANDDLLYNQVFGNYEGIRAHHYKEYIANLCYYILKNHDDRIKYDMVHRIPATQTEPAKSMRRTGDAIAYSSVAKLGQELGGNIVPDSWNFEEGINSNPYNPLTLSNTYMDENWFTDGSDTASVEIINGYNLPATMYNTIEEMVNDDFQIKEVVEGAVESTGAGAGSTNPTNRRATLFDQTSMGLSILASSSSNPVDKFTTVTDIGLSKPYIKYYTSLLAEYADPEGHPDIMVPDYLNVRPYKKLNSMPLMLPYYSKVRGEKPTNTTHGIKLLYRSLRSEEFKDEGAVYTLSNVKRMLRTLLGNIQAVALEPAITPTTDRDYTAFINAVAESIDITDTPGAIGRQLGYIDFSETEETIIKIILKTSRSITVEDGDQSGAPAFGVGTHVLVNAANLMPKNKGMNINMNTCGQMCGILTGATYDPSQREDDSGAIEMDDLRTLVISDIAGENVDLLLTSCEYNEDGYVTIKYKPLKRLEGVRLNFHPVYYNVTTGEPTNDLSHSPNRCPHCPNNIQLAERFEKTIHAIIGNLQVWETEASSRNASSGILIGQIEDNPNTIGGIAADFIKRIKTAVTYTGARAGQTTGLEGLSEGIFFPFDLLMFFIDVIRKVITIVGEDNIANPISHILTDTRKLQFTVVKVYLDFMHDVYRGIPTNNMDFGVEIITRLQVEDNITRLRERAAINTANGDTDLQNMIERLTNTSEDAENVENNIALYNPEERTTSLVGLDILTTQKYVEAVKCIKEARDRESVVIEQSLTTNEKLSDESIIFSAVTRSGGENLFLFTNEPLSNPQVNEIGIESTIQTVKEGLIKALEVLTISLVSNPIKWKTLSINPTDTPTPYERADKAQTTITEYSINMDNNMVPIYMDGHENPVVQDLGGNGTAIQLVLVTNDGCLMEDIAEACVELNVAMRIHGMLSHLTPFMPINKRLTKPFAETDTLLYNKWRDKLRKKINRMASQQEVGDEGLRTDTPIIIINDIANMCGIYGVAVTDIQMKTMDGFPGTYQIALNMISVDINQTDREVPRKVRFDYYYADRIIADVCAQPSYYYLSKLLEDNSYMPETIRESGETVSNVVNNVEKVTAMLAFLAVLANIEELDAIVTDTKNGPERTPYEGDWPNHVRKPKLSVDKSAAAWITHGQGMNKNYTDDFEALDSIMEYYFDYVTKDLTLPLLEAYTSGKPLQEAHKDAVSVIKNLIQKVERSLNNYVGSKAPDIMTKHGMGIFSLDLKAPMLYPEISKTVRNVLMKSPALLGLSTSANYMKLDNFKNVIGTIDFIHHFIALSQRIAPASVNVADWIDCLNIFEWEKDFTSKLNAPSNPSTYYIERMLKGMIDLVLPTVPMLGLSYLFTLVNYQYGLFTCAAWANSKEEFWDHILVRLGSTNTDYQKRIEAVKKRILLAPNMSQQQQLKYIYNTDTDTNTSTVSMVDNPGRVLLFNKAEIELIKEMSKALENTSLSNIWTGADGRIPIKDTVLECGDSPNKTYLPRTGSTVGFQSIGPTDRPNRGTFKSLLIYGETNGTINDELDPVEPERLTEGMRGLSYDDLAVNALNQSSEDPIDSSRPYELFASNIFTRRLFDLIRVISTGIDDPEINNLKEIVKNIRETILKQWQLSKIDGETTEPYSVVRLNGEQSIIRENESPFILDSFISIYVITNSELRNHKAALRGEGLRFWTVVSNMVVGGIRLAQTVNPLPLYLRTWHALVHEAENYIFPNSDPNNLLHKVYKGYLTAHDWLNTFPLFIASLIRKEAYGLNRGVYKSGFSMNLTIGLILKYAHMLSEFFVMPSVMSIMRNEGTNRTLLGDISLTDNPSAMQEKIISQYMKNINDPTHTWKAYEVISPITILIISSTIGLQHARLAKMYDAYNSYADKPVPLINDITTMDGQSRHRTNMEIAQLYTKPDFFIYKDPASMGQTFFYFSRLIEQSARFASLSDAQMGPTTNPADLILHPWETIESQISSERASYQNLAREILINISMNSDDQWMQLHTYADNIALSLGPVIARGKCHNDATQEDIANESAIQTERILGFLDPTSNVSYTGSGGSVGYTLNEMQSTYNEIIEVQTKIANTEAGSQTKLYNELLRLQKRLATLRSSISYAGVRDVTRIVSTHAKESMPYYIQMLNDYRSILSGVTNNLQLGSRIMEIGAKRNITLADKMLLDSLSNPSNGAYSLETFMHMDKQLRRSMFMNAKKGIRSGFGGLMPTFKLYIIEEDMKELLMFNDFYGYHAVISIETFEDRKSASQTAVIKVANVYGRLTNIMADRFNRENPFSVAPDDNSNLVSMMLRPGAMIQVRLGYNARLGPETIVFSGEIAELQGEGQPVLTIVAQSWGTQLTRPIGTGKGEDFRKMLRVMGHNAYKTLNLISELMDMAAPLGHLGSKSPLLGELFARQIELDKSMMWLKRQLYQTASKQIKKRFDISTHFIDTRLTNVFVTRDEGGYFKNSSRWLVYNETLWDSLQDLTYQFPNRKIAVRPMDEEGTVVIGDDDDVYQYTIENAADTQRIWPTLLILREASKKGTDSFYIISQILINECAKAREVYMGDAPYPSFDTPDSNGQPLRPVAYMLYNMLVRSYVMMSGKSAFTTNAFDPEGLVELIAGNTTISTNRDFPITKGTIEEGLEAISSVNQNMIDEANMDVAGMSENYDANTSGTVTMEGEGIFSHKTEIPLEVFLLEKVGPDILQILVIECANSVVGFRMLSETHIKTTAKDIIQNNITLQQGFNRVDMSYMYEELLASLFTAIDTLLGGAIAGDNIGTLIGYPPITVTNIENSKSRNKITVSASPLLKAHAVRTYATFQKNAALRSGICFRREYFVANAILANLIKDYYGGQLIIHLDPSIRVHDVIMLYDDINDMWGSIGVKSVQHKISKQTGAITIIEPDVYTRSRITEDRIPMSRTMMFNKFAVPYLLRSVIDIALTVITIGTLSNAISGMAAKMTAMFTKNATAKTAVSTMILAATTQGGKESAEAMGKAFAGYMLGFGDDTAQGILKGMGRSIGSLSDDALRAANVTRAQATRVASALNTTASAGGNSATLYRGMFEVLSEGVEGGAGSVMNALRPALFGSAGTFTLSSTPAIANAAIHGLMRAFVSPLYGFRFGGTIGHATAFLIRVGILRGIGKMFFPIPAIEGFTRAVGEYLTNRDPILIVGLVHKGDAFIGNLEGMRKSASLGLSEIVTERLSEAIRPITEAIASIEDSVRILQTQTDLMGVSSRWGINPSISSATPEFVNRIKLEELVASLYSVD